MNMQPALDKQGTYQLHAAERMTNGGRGGSMQWHCEQCACPFCVCLVIWLKNGEGNEAYSRLI